MTKEEYQRTVATIFRKTKQVDRETCQIDIIGALKAGIPMGGLGGDPIYTSGDGMRRARELGLLSKGKMQVEIPDETIEEAIKRIFKT